MDFLFFNYLNHPDSSHLPDCRRCRNSSRFFRIWTDVSFERRDNRFFSLYRRQGATASRPSSVKLKHTISALLDGFLDNPPEKRQRGYGTNRNPLFFLARPEGFEPPANGFEVHSIPDDCVLLCCIMLILRLIQKHRPIIMLNVLIISSCFVYQHITIT